MTRTLWTMTRGLAALLGVVSALSLEVPFVLAQGTDAPPAPTEAAVEARRLRDAGRFQEAVAAYQRFLAANPEAWQVRYEFAQLLLTLRQLDAAEVQLQAVLLSSKKQPAAWERLGQVYLLKNDLQSAERALLYARDMDPSDATVRYNLGRLYEKQIRDDEALTEYTAFLDLAADDPRAPNIRRKVAFYYENKGRPEEATEHLRILVETRPDELSIRQTLADLLYKQTLYDEALGHYRKVVELDPNNLAAHYNIGFILKAKANLEEAEKEFLICEELRPGAPGTLFLLGGIRFDRGDFQGAASFFERLIAVEPEHEQAHYYYARALAKLGRMEEAKKELAIHQQIEKKNIKRTPAGMETVPAVP